MPRLFRRKSQDAEYDEIPSDAEFPLEDVDTTDEALPFDDEQQPFVPFVPVESERSYGLDRYGLDRYGLDPYEFDTNDSEDALAPDTPIHRARTRRFRLSRPQLSRPEIWRPTSPIRVEFGMLFLVLALIALGIFGTLLNRDQVDGDVGDWWPLAVIAIAVVWMLAALVQRRIPAFLASAGLAGIGISLLMDTQDVASLNESVLGVVLVTLGFGIVVRGFVLRQQTYG